MGNFRKNLRDELDYQALTVKELAAKSSVATGALNCYLGTQESTPSADAAVKIARALGVSVEYLITGHDSRAAKTKAALNTEIRELVQITEELDGDSRQVMLTLAKSLKEMQDKRQI